MQSFLYFLATFVCALIGGLLAKKLKLPAGPLVGSMVFVVAFNLITESAVFYPQIKVGLQIFSGAMIGSTMSMAEVKSMKILGKPTLILLVSMVLLNLTFGFAIYAFTPLDAATSLFAAAPGGVSDMALIASDLNANTGYVAILQIFRILIVLLVFPPFFKKFSGSQKSLGNTVEKSTALQKAKPKWEPARFALLLLFGAIGGMLLYYLGVTAGAMIGGMLSGTIYCVLTKKVYFPKQIKTLMQVCSGAYIGRQITRESLLSISVLGLPIGIMLICIVTFVFLISWILVKTTKLDRLTAMMASTPGGLQEMALLADDLGADTPKIAVMHTLRVFTVILLFPTMLSFLIKILS